MYDLKCEAKRENNTIKLIVSGYLPNSCYSAKIIDNSPHNKISNNANLKVAQIFIQEKKEDRICLEALMPWKEEIEIKDSSYKKIDIFINNQLKLSCNIEEI